MTDIVINAIKQNSITSDNISFNLIRRIAGSDSDIWEQLERGRAILSSVQQLDQYLYSYGLMIQSQWQDALSDLSVELNDDITLVDYGCGQGLATLLFCENTELLDSVSEIVLVEPSEVALERAIAIVRCCCPNATIRAVCKKLDDLSEDDFGLNNNLKIHLFSNVLDIKGFDQISLFEKILDEAGEHYVFALSHDRDHNGGSGRINELFEFFLDEECGYDVLDIDLKMFNCSRGQPTIFFYMHVEVFV